MQVKASVFLNYEIQWHFMIVRFGGDAHWSSGLAKIKRSSPNPTFYQDE